jgi:hypothetical protein
MDTGEPVQAPKPAASKPPRRQRRRFVPAVLLTLLVLLLAWGALRGTWADTVPRNPASSAEGVVAQLYQTADGRKQVRLAAMLDYPLEDVWAVVTDYEHFAEIFPFVQSAQATPSPDGRFHDVKGVVSTWVGEWPFEARVRHDEYLNDCVALWDQPSGDLTVNRGSWTVLRYGAGKTLLIYTLELEVRPYPTVVVRNALLSGLKPVVGAVEKRLRAKRGG